MDQLESRLEEESLFIRKHVLANYKEADICKKFGCGKKLTRSEALYGDKCQEHSCEVKVDIMKVIKV